MGQNYLTLALLTYLSLIKQKQFLISGTELAYHSNNICAFCSHILSLYWNSFQHAPGSHQRSWPVLEPGVPSGPLALNPQPCGRPHIQVSSELLQEDITVGEPSLFIPTEAWLTYLCHPPLAWWKEMSQLFYFLLLNCKVTVESGGSPGFALHQHQEDPSLPSFLHELIAPKLV